MESLSPGVGWGSIFWSMLRQSALVFLRSSCIWWMFSPAFLGWIWTGVFFAYQTPGTRKLTWNLDGYFVGGSEQQKKQQVKKIWDLNGFRDPSFPLHLVKENMCHLDAFGLNLDWWPHFVSPYAPPGQALLHQPAVSPGCGRRTHNGNQYGTQRV